MNAKSFVAGRMLLARPPRRRQRISGGAAVAVTSVGLFVLALQPAVAQEQPPGCTFAGAGGNAAPSPTGKVYPGETICYQYRYDNGILGVNCNIENLDADFWLPNTPFGPIGTGIPVLIDASIASGDSVLCPGNAACNPALLASDYCYLVSLADDVASFSGCPPTLGPAPALGQTGRVVSYTEGLGDALTQEGDFAAPCGTANNIVARCGDGVRDLGICLNSSPRVACTNGTCTGGLTCIGFETCDDGNAVNTDACRNNCTFCGDGFLDAGEDCDDGNNIDHDGCSAVCTTETCAVRVDKQVSCDGILWFDVGLVLNNNDGTLGPIPGCNVNDPVFVRYQVSNVGDVNVEDCTLTESSGVIAPGGTVQSGFSIGFGVTLPPTNPDSNQDCTDSLEAQEPDTARLVCDCVQPSLPPGTAQASDTATVDCVPICGDGIVGNTPGETCDPPGSAVGSPGETCRADCTFCGDGRVDAGEQCDDGNETNGDGCEANCTLSPECGDGIVGNTPGETCDPPGSAVGSPGETCRDNCTFCGDGNVDAGETCDDGNETAGDGCEPDCTVPEGEELCRTPGFWGTHGCGQAGGFTGCEKERSQNITRTVIEDCGGCLDVCGDVITNDRLNSSDSALEAICVSIRAESVRQLARQLTAAALNCCISGSDDTCDGISINDVFDDCNSACAAGNVAIVIGSDTVNCIDAIDCFNNGGQFNNSTGFCRTGTCANGDPCNDETPCVDFSACTPLASSCHERAEDLFGICDDGSLCFDGTCGDGSVCAPGPAGSSRACDAAIGNRCYVIGTTDCAGADDSNAPQSCP